MPKTVKTKHTVKIVAVAIVAIVTILGLLLARPTLKIQTVKNDIGTAVLGANTQAPSYQLTVDKITSAGLGTSSQKQRITVKTTIKNLSSKVMQVSPGLQMTLTDQNKTTYSYTAKFVAFGTVVGGPLAPSVSRTQDIDFELPLKSVPKQFVFQLDGATPVTKVNL